MNRVDMETIWYETRAEGVTLITLNRPDHANGVVPELARDLLAALDHCEKDLSVRCVVLTGAGRQFCAGADLDAVYRYATDAVHSEHEPFNMRVLAPITLKLVSCRMPVVAAINGGATAGGFDLALACDLRIASEAAKLGETYIKIGAVPANGGTYFLPRLVGSAIAAELAFTGELVDAARALDLGLVSRVVPPDDLLDTAVELAATIAQKPWRALEATKQALRASWHQDLTAALNQAFWVTALLTHTQDFREGVESFRQKRPAHFNRFDPPRMHWEI